MGVLSRYNKISKPSEPICVRGLAVSSEPAYITSWESARVCGPPGLEVDDSITTFPDEKTREFEDFSLKAPATITYIPHFDVPKTAVGKVLKQTSTYNPRSERPPWFNQQVNNLQVTSKRGVQHVNRHVPSNVPRRHKRHQKRRCFLLIATQLRQLENEDPGKLLIVRKINRLGFDSADILQEHYKRYGGICKVLLSNKHDKRADAPFPVRLRPSGIGYVLFETVEGATKALAEGNQQVVAGVEIIVCAFEKRHPPVESDGDDGDGGEDGDGAEDGEDGEGAEDGGTATDSYQ